MGSYFRGFAHTLLMLFTLATALTASASDFSVYQKDGRLDITLALSFQQNEINVLTNNEAAVQSDVALILSELLYSCSECQLRQTFRDSGLVVLQGYASVDGGSSFLTTVKILFPEKGVSAAQLRRAFRIALANDDAVMYMGHSRDGMAFADFGSPLDTRGKVFRRGVEAKEVESLNIFRGASRPILLIVHSCLSQKYFQTLLTDGWSSRLGFDAYIGLTTANNDFSDFSSSALALVRSLIVGADRKTFEGDFQKAQHSYRAHYNAASQVEPSVPPLFYFWSTGANP